MQPVMQQIAAVPGVVGSMVCDAGGEVVASVFPPAVDAAAVRMVAAQLGSDVCLPGWMSGEAAWLDLRFADGRVVVRPFTGGYVLVLCAAQVNQQLLALALAQAIRRLQARAPAPPVAASPPAAPVPSLPDRLRVIVRGELAAHATQALEILAAAGSDPAALRGAVADVERLTRLFISRKKAEEIGRRMRQVIDGEPG